MTEIQQYDRVRIVTSRFEDLGVSAGMRGYVVETYPDGELEIEISDSTNGETIALFAARPADVELDA
ncbi:hypothetical protein [Asanoa iriomotensis]|uniref:DUF4926 domain-containing protein n=1 Tax=Asanoa iriomotensis TaxID=234613 RepID=A0ABQ4BTX2_9ACTN|nr:hypothetical protein [Asanoa iriomotensis]GIF53972.1 hypothetical protein Air01nite_00670 [Asanoa iriomotensis]